MLCLIANEHRLGYLLPPSRLCPLYNSIRGVIAPHCIYRYPDHSPLYQFAFKCIPSGYPLSGCLRPYRMLRYVTLR